MRIAYISTAKRAATLSVKQESLNNAYLKDIKLSYTKNKTKLTESGISETQFIFIMKQKIGI